MRLHERALGKLGMATLVALLALAAPSACLAQGMTLPDMIPGISGGVINLTATDGHISTGEGNSVYVWGLALQGGAMQYPAPTLIVMQGDTLQVNLTNQLNVPVSLLFPGQNAVASGGTPGLLTREAAPNGGTVSYTFTASEPGTYLYHSGTLPDLQIEMGLVGALIVRPVVGGVMQHMWAYASPATAFDREFLFLLTDMDVKIHDLVEAGRLADVDLAARYPVYWFINGRNLPDTMAEAGASWLPTQPYNCMPMFYPGEKVLMRVLGGGRDPHPFHHHGNNSLVIARDGRMLQSAPGAGPDLAESVFTITSSPGGTSDSIFVWTGEKLGWDAYGHKPTDPLAQGEYAPDHGKPFPVVLPDQQNLTFGLMYGGGPFLGTSATLPPGEGGFNPMAAFSFMWHSHNEKEICNNDVFIGGMATMAMVLPYPAKKTPPQPKAATAPPR